MYPTKILLATDGSEESAPAARTAVELANGTGSELHVAHAILTAPQRPYPRRFERARSEDLLHRKRLAALTLLDEKVMQVEKMGGIVAGSYYREGDPTDEVLSLADTPSSYRSTPGRPNLVCFTRERLFHLAHPARWNRLGVDGLTSPPWSPPHRGGDPLDRAASHVICREYAR